MRPAAKGKTLAVATALAVLMTALPAPRAWASVCSPASSPRFQQTRVMGSHRFRAVLVGDLAELNTRGLRGCRQVYDGSAAGVLVFENHLIAVNPGTPGSIMLLYDGDGNRVSKTVNGVTTKYLVDDNNPTGYAQVVEELTNGSVSRTYTHGDMLISESQLITGNWTSSFYGLDGSGSVRFLTNSSGAVTDTYDYDAFGILIRQSGSTPNLYLYSGEQFDPDLALYYQRSRYLNTSNGRFWTIDSFEGLGSDPHTLHKYVYVGNNPVNRTDPSGRFEFTIAGTTYTLSISSAIRSISAIAAGAGRAAVLRLLTLAFLVNSAIYSPVLFHFGETFEELEGTGEAGVQEIQAAFSGFDGTVSEIESEGSSLAESGAQNFDKFREIYNKFLTGGETNPANIEWHHLVEQSQGETEQAVGFSSRAINSLSNVVPTPANVHQQISTFYSTRAAWLPRGVSSVRDWMSTQDWETQWRAGLEIWKQAMRGESITWHPGM
jgi:RHS repeat-associated protein